MWRQHLQFFVPVYPSKDIIMTDTKTHMACEHHHLAAAHHVAAAYHHFQAAAKLTEGDHDAAKAHCATAHTDGEAACKHRESAVAHTQP